MNTLRDTDLMALCDTAQLAARVAGAYIQSQVGEEHAAERKAGGSSLAAQVVTAVDLRAQEIILEHVADSIKQYDLGLLTEETPDDQSRLIKPYFWCIDPMDGTLAFTERRSGYAVSLALVSQAGDPVVGAVYIPDTGDGYAAVKGGGVRRNGAPFVRPKAPSRPALQVYLDRSAAKAPHYAAATTRLRTWSARQGLAEPDYHPGSAPSNRKGYGAVRNAIAVMHAPIGVYFKYPKPQRGGGSIWDYAATRLFFEELALPVSDAHGQRLHLNRSESTYMNAVGVVYATEADLVGEVVRR